MILSPSILSMLISAKRLSITVVSLFLAAQCILMGAEVPPAGAGDIKVMSYNIRFGTAKDKENVWANRKEFLVDAIKAFAPDLLGTQETLEFQRDYLTESLTDHAVFGVGRDDGKDKGEMAAMFFKKDRFEKVDGGHFWLSEKPTEPGSMSWDTSLTRMASWLRLKDKAREGKPILWVNTHLDHKGKVAKLESARLIRKQIGTLGADCSVIVTGDFNSGEGSRPYSALFGENGDEKSPIVDSFRIAKPTRTEDEGTTTPFLAAPNKAARIDWIGVSRDWKIVGGGIERPDREGRTPSDHFPVFAILQR